MKERQEKIAQLKAAVENGTYKVDGKGIAEKMVNFINSNKRRKSVQ